MGTPAVQKLLAEQRARTRRTPAVQRLFEQQRAQATVVDLLTLTSIDDVKGELEQLRAAYDNVNASAHGRAEWDTHYAEFRAYYDRMKAKMSTWLGSVGWGVGQAAIDQMRDRRSQLEAWKKKLASEGVKVLEPERREPTKDNTDGILKNAAILVAVVAGGFVAYKVLT